MRYDIPTLLGMCHNGQIPLDRFSGPAVDNNLVRPQARSTNPLSEQPVNQPKTRLDSPCSGAAISGMQPLPRPSPHTPLQSSQPILSQGYDGFHQFVKTHSSPKHQRVTAGGRIVPMEPQLAVPDFNLSRADEIEGRKPEPNSSENTPTQAMHTNLATGDKMKTPYVTPVDLPDIHQQPNVANDLCQSLHIPGYDSGYTSVFPSVTPTPGMFLQPRMPVEYRNQQYAHRVEYSPQPYYQPVLADSHTYGVGVFGVDTPTWHPSVYPVMNAQGSAVPLPATIQPYNPATAVPGFIPGHHHQTVMPPSTFGQYAQYPAPLDTRYVNSVSQWNPDTPKAAQHVTLSQTPVLTGPSIAEMPSHKSLEEAKKRHDLLSGQLSRLDRYTALHSWEIDPESKQLFVQQRMTLVKELDTLRLYREQLDVIYEGSNAGSSSVKTRTGPFYQTHHKSSRPGKFAGDRVPQALPLSSSGSQSAGPGWITPGPLVVPPPAAHGSLEQPFLKQSIENANSLAHNGGARRAPSGCESLTESNLLYNEQIRRADFVPVKRALHAQTIKAAFPEDPGRGAAPQDGTSRLQKLYNKIEAANTRREPVGGLLRELSVVTAGLINDRTKKDDGVTPRTFERRVPLTAESTNRAPPAKSAPRHVPEKSRGMQHIRRFWESEPSPEIPSKNLRGVSPETDDGSHSRPPSSHVSTTDSWTTVQKSDTRYFDRESLSDEHPGRRLDSIWKSRPGDRLHTFDSRLVGSTKVGTGGSWSKKIGTKMKSISVIQRPSGPKAAPTKGFVAPFDGAGDAPDQDCAFSQKSADQEREQVQEQVQEPWYKKKERVKASYAVVREFLERIENEETSMVYEYRMTGPGSWW